jgi:CRISPR-associated protein Csd1
MGLFQHLLETYEKCSEAVGILEIDADGSANEKKTLLPIGHMTFKSEISVTIDECGNFISARRDNKETTIIIPCTEKSSGRASGVAAHPLCDQLDYVGGINDKKTKAYLAELQAWKEDMVELNAIYAYVSGNTMIDDLINSNIFKEGEYKNKSERIKSQLDKEKIRKIVVRFIIQYQGNVIKVWESKSLRDAWTSHLNCQSTCSEPYFDYLSGDAISQIASQHPKNINSITGNAKLLSCNDTRGFTFRGRFDKQNDAVLIDYAQSQKMHQTLRWLIANHGYHADSQVIVAWAVDSDTEVNAKYQDNTLDIFGDMEKSKTDTEVLVEASRQVYIDYAKKLNNLFQGYGNSNNLKQHSRKICIAAFDAATTGRMGLVFYQELFENEYLESIVKWHNDTSYFQTAWKKGQDEKGKNSKNIPIHYIGAPSYDDILFAVYGKSHGDKYYGILKKKIRKQLLECMFGNFAFPKSIVEMASNRASRPMSFVDSNGMFSESDWRRAISITCAIARKYYKEQKEEIQLELDTSRRDRDYLYGRLLAIADKLESTALYKADKQNTRPTNATRLMNAFQIKPYATWGQLYNQLIPYKNQLNGAGYYQALIDSIMVLFKEGDYENNSPLSPLYLLGYSAQNRELSQYNKNEKMEVTEE